jgi:hypothetical protein
VPAFHPCERATPTQCAPQPHQVSDQRRRSAVHLWRWVRVKVRVDEHVDSREAWSGKHTHPISSNVPTTSTRPAISKSSSASSWAEGERTGEGAEGRQGRWCEVVMRVKLAPHRCVVRSGRDVESLTVWPSEQCQPRDEKNGVRETALNGRGVAKGVCLSLCKVQTDGRSRRGSREGGGLCAPARIAHCASFTSHAQPARGATRLRHVQRS